MGALGRWRGRGRAAGGFDLFLGQSRIFHLEDLLDRTNRRLGGWSRTGRKRRDHGVSSEETGEDVIDSGRNVAALGTLTFSNSIVPYDGARGRALAPARSGR